MAKGGQAGILAVAYSELNGNGRFDNKELIASIVDTNHDKTVSVGDTVSYGTYPLHIDGTGERGTFTQTTIEVTGVGTVNGSYAELVTGPGPGLGGNLLQFLSNDSQGG